MTSKYLCYLVKIFQHPQLLSFISSHIWEIMHHMVAWKDFLDVYLDMYFEMTPANVLVEQD